VAMQTRHVHNRQHAIPFRQQFIEQLVHDAREIDRKIKADRRKYAEKIDKQNGRLRRELEVRNQV